MGCVASREEILVSFREVRLHAAHAGKICDALRAMPDARLFVLQGGKSIASTAQAPRVLASSVSLNETMLLHVRAGHIMFALGESPEHGLVFAEVPRIEEIRDGSIEVVVCRALTVVSRGRRSARPSSDRVGVLSLTLQRDVTTLEDQKPDTRLLG